LFSRSLLRLKKKTIRTTQTINKINTAIPTPTPIPTIEESLPTELEFNEFPEGFSEVIGAVVIVEIGVGELGVGIGVG